MLTDFYGVTVNSYNNCYSLPLQQYEGYTPSDLSASDLTEAASSDNMSVS